MQLLKSRFGVECVEFRQGTVNPKLKAAKTIENTARIIYTITSRELTPT